MQVALTNPLGAKLQRLFEIANFRVFDRLRYGPRKWPNLGQKWKFSKPRVGTRIYRLESLSIGLRLPGYFFHAARKGPGMGLLEDTYGRTQKMATRRCPKRPPGTTFWQKSQKWGFFAIFRFARLNHLKKPVLLIYGSGGRHKRTGAQNSQNRLWRPFWPNRHFGPSGPGVRNPPKILLWNVHFNLSRTFTNLFQLFFTSFWFKMLL